MKLDKREVVIKFDMAIDDNGEMEYNTVKETGTFFHKNGRDVLIYEEELEEGVKVRNLLTIQSDKVTLKRTGAIEMNQQFLMNKATGNIYHHPHGKIHMETYTSSIDYESIRTAETGKISIAYTVKLNGQDGARQHVMTLLYQEEDMK